MSANNVDPIASRLSRTSESKQRILEELKTDKTLLEAPGDPQDLPDPDIDTTEDVSDDMPDPKSILAKKKADLGMKDDDEEDLEYDEDEVEDKDEEEEPDKKLSLKEEDKDVKNPLDNPYAVSFEIGQRVTLVYTDGSSTSVDATIEGYDKEGFYRVRLDSGLTISGLTDLCLVEYVSSNLHEGSRSCVCGHSKFVEEDGVLVCDYCGRPIDEGDDMSILEISPRQYTRKKIKSILNKMSTGDKPDINDIPM